MKRRGHDMRNQICLDLFKFKRSFDT